MRILFLGDVVGRPGRMVIGENLENIIRDEQIDFTIIDVDNASGGFGMNRAHGDEFFRIGADCLTGGNHIWDAPNVNQMLEEEPRILRPHNYPKKSPGKGVLEIEKNGRKLVVIHLLGQVFMHENVNCPFECVDEILAGYKLGSNVDGIFVDMHAETSSEKQAMGLYLDGRVTAVVGSHTHTPTDDARILPQGTAYMTDAGMCGDYNSVIGFEKTEPLFRFLKKVRKNRMQIASGAATLRGCIIDAKSKEIKPVKL